MRLALALALSAFGLASLAHAGVPHKMIEIGAGAESSSKGGGVNVLLHVSENLVAGPSDQRVRFQAVIARLNADIAISPSNPDDRVPYLNIDFTPAGFMGGEEAGGGDLLPIKITRDVRLGNEATLRIDAIGIWYDGEHADDIRDDIKGDIYGKFAIAALGYRLTSFVGEGNFQGFDIGALEAEGGFFSRLSSTFSIKAGVGTSLGVSLGRFTDSSGTESILDGNVYAQVKADIGEFVTLFLRGGGRIMSRSETGYDSPVDFQFMSGAVLNID